MAIFEKKLRAIASTIKDDFIKKYVLEYFLEKIAELTPHSNQNKKKYYVRTIKSLDSTKKHFNESQSVSGVELKEFSLLYLVLNNLPLLQANIHLIENIKLFTEINKQIFNATIDKLKSGEQITIKDLDIANRSGPNKKDTDDEDIKKLIKKMVKQRTESIEIYKQNNRDDLLEVEQNEYNILTGFLPKQLGEEETKKICAEVISKLGASSVKDMGKVMCELKKLLADEIDFAIAGPLIKELLNS
jgi:uncharacterized protein YqeY